MPELQSKLHYEVIDHRSPWVRARETIVFHHGLGACSACWNGWFAPLLEHYRLVVFDMRGHGESPPLKGADIPSLIEDLDSVIRGPGNGQCHLVGESIGGTIALAYAARFPKRIRSLTVSNGAHMGGSLENLSNWRDLTADGDMSHWSEHMMNMRFYPDVLSDDMWQWYKEQQAQANREFVLGAVEALAGANLSPVLHAVTSPVLILHPDDSPFIPLEVALDLKSKLKHARMQVFANTRHGLPFSHANQCSHTLMQFLAELS